MSSNFRLEISKNFLDQAKNIKTETILDQATKFIYLWISLNSIYGDLYPGENERDAVRAFTGFKNDLISDAIDYENLQYGIINRMSELLKIEPISDMKKVFKKSEKKSYETYITNIRYKIEQDKRISHKYFLQNAYDPYIWMSLIYGVRNNLFHGSKLNPGDTERDSKIFSILLPLLEEIVEKSLN
jgi:hypothetical protein